MLGANFRRIAFAALFSGLGAGLLLTGFQAIDVLPLIDEAERYEVAAEPQSDHAHGETHSGSAIAESGSEPAKRIAMTAVTNVATAIGSAFILCAIYTLRGGVTTRQGVLFGLGAYVGVFLNPAIGMPPELPGMHGAELFDRQAWWLLAVVCSLGGLALIGFVREGVAALAGAILLLSPHLIGAPSVPPDAAVTLPAHLPAQFFTATAVVNCVYWLMLGVFSALLFGERLSPRANAPEPAES